VYKVDFLPPSGVEDKNEWIYTSAPTKMPLWLGQITFYRYLKNYRIIGYQSEINERIKKGNATYYKNRKLLTSKLLTRNIKLRLYLTLIRPIVTDGAETWTATESELQKLLIFERKI
jgi:hypothetical protein